MLKLQRHADPTLMPRDAGQNKRRSAQAGQATSKRRRGKDDGLRRLFAPDAGAPSDEACVPPARRHGLEYHRPLLLHRVEMRQLLLAWFDSVSTARTMPWRKPWIDPRPATDATTLRQALERRAYEVWISEVMLQQTRVAVVVEYWTRWMARWPTIHDLARARLPQVLDAWRGLGYYSRATRIHQAAKLVVEDPEMQGLLPATASKLEARLPGVGRYTAGAISAIVFGRAEPMVDGNVLRVLSRQLGIYGNVKTDKSVMDVLWAAADALVKAVAHGDADDECAAAHGTISDRPGLWGQALMELGSTVCKPKPDCASCPITSTCRAYSEGMAWADKETAVAGAIDMEDVCSLCKPLEALEGFAEGLDHEADMDSRYFPTPRGAALPAKGRVEAAAGYARKFPARSEKKAVRKEEVVVCAIRRQDGRYLVQRRRQKGLLAGLWEFPSSAVGEAGETGPRQRVQIANAHASTLVTTTSGRIKHMGELGSVPWLFSHLRLIMHVHLFVAAGDDCETAAEGAAEGAAESTARRWSDNVEQETMGTGMRKCWMLVRDSRWSRHQDKEA